METHRQTTPRRPDTHQHTQIYADPTHTHTLSYLVAPAAIVVVVCVLCVCVVGDEQQRFAWPGFDAPQAERVLAPMSARKRRANDSDSGAASSSKPSKRLDVRYHSGLYSSIAAMPSQGQVVDLKYDVHSWSSFSARYHPRNIMVDDPSDQASRWSSGCNTQAQFIMLRLPQPAVIKEIQFGKFEKSHVCNLKEFKVLGGLKTTNMIELVRNGLRNDSEPETFRTVHTVRGVTFPCQYIKIVPILAWGQNFNFSVWYVGLRGISEEPVARAAQHAYETLREREAIRLCLKHFRQRNLLKCFEDLQQSTGVELEAPCLTELYKTIVLEGDYQKAEELITTSTEGDVLAEYISTLPYRPCWKLLAPVDKDAATPSGAAPGMRGGHQMCFDSETGLLYLLGGWDGKRDLADFWQYSIHDNQWTLLSADTVTCGGPGARSCHKMAINPRTKQIFVSGQFVDHASRQDVLLHGDLYCYHIESRQWELLSDNTQADGGPSLIYDHQICVDSQNEVLYVFGGSTIVEGEQGHYSGLYSFDCKKLEWTLLREDQGMGKGNVKLPSRIGHSMLFDSNKRQLYIFAGQRNHAYLNDFFKYHIDEDIVEQVCRDSSTQGGPDPGFTQRATIDSSVGELYILSGLVREKNTVKPEVKGDDTAKNSFWVYDLTQDQWNCAYQNDNNDPEYWSKKCTEEPRPRFAHQLVFDTRNKVHYLFGGNPGGAARRDERLADFWSLRLLKPSREDILNRCFFFLRKQRYLEMCKSDPRNALKYLQTELAAVVDHNDAAQSTDFRELASSLFAAPESSSTLEDTLYTSRIDVYETLLGFFPAHMKQPQDNLIDLPML
eukprot:m.86923 g.86923  ORF g.86923 m.86923 type:complete len:836 (+) comp14891_c0_seq3:166-2673(+)